MNNFIHS